MSVLHLKTLYFLIKWYLWEEMNKFMMWIWTPVHLKKVLRPWVRTSLPWYTSMINPDCCVLFCKMLKHLFPVLVSSLYTSYVKLLLCSPVTMHGCLPTSIAITCVSLATPPFVFSLGRLALLCQLVRSCVSGTCFSFSYLWFWSLLFWGVSSAFCFLESLPVLCICLLSPYKDI